MAESDDQEEPSASDDDWRLTGQEDVLARAHVSADEPRFCSTYPGPRRRAVALSGNKVWSRDGAPWLQPVAIGGKSRSLRNGRNKRKPLPWVATGCRLERMVRRGSTVRVRQRALQKRRTSALSRSGGLAPRPTCGGYGALDGAFRSRSECERRRSIGDCDRRVDGSSGGGLCRPSRLGDADVLVRAD